MNRSFLRGSVAISAFLVLAACGGGGASGERANSEPTLPPEEITDPANYQELSVRTAGDAALAYVILEGDAARFSDSVSFNYATGAISGGLLSGTDIDDDAFTNPAGSEFSRVLEISRVGADNLFGVVGLDVQTGDRPTSGTTDYNEGWVGMTAIFEDEVLALEGDATFTVTWNGSGDIDGRFFNLSGFNRTGQTVTNRGTIVLTDGNISGDRFSGGRVTGTGVFSELSGSSSTAGTLGAFFGPDAEELGGVLVINDSSEQIQVLGAFQAD